jgi:DNA-binding winged helix-turn-helix (wHTH) protein
MYLLSTAIVGAYVFVIFMLCLKNRCNFNIIENPMAVRISAVIFDEEQRTLKSDSQTRKLEPKVFSLLTALLAANGKIVTRDQLIVEVWNNRVVGEGAINRTVSLLRNHFSAFTDKTIIETVPTQGYRLVATVTNTDISHDKMPADQKVAFKSQLFKKPVRNIKKASIIAVTIALLLIALLSTASKVKNLTTPNQLSLVSAPLVGLQGREYKLSATQSGGLILFHHLDEDDRQSIYLYNTKTHAQNQILTNSLAAISADGKRIVYATHLNEQCLISIYYVLTKQKQSLFPCDEPPTSLVWGENNTFYFNKRFSKSHPYQVYSYNVNTSRLKQITNPNSKNNTKGDFDFSYNHHNNQLAIIRYISESESTIIIKLEEQQLNKHTVNLRLKNLVWHPNGNTLIIADTNRLFSLDTTNGQYTLLKQLDFTISSLAVIPTKLNASLLVSSLDVVSEIVKYDTLNHSQHVWQQSARTELLPRMQAHTQTFLSTRYKSHHFWRIKNNKAQLIDIDFPFDLQFVRYELSDDGSRILFTKHGDVFELDLNKNTYQKVFIKNRSSYVANYDAHNNIIYSGNYSGQWQLWLYQRSTDKHTQLTLNGGYSGRIVDQYLYYSKFNVDGLWRKKLTESNEELVIKDFNRINWLNWQLINQNLYFYREATGIWAFDIKTQKESLIMPKPDNFVHQYTIAPDQQYIFWVRLKAIQGDIYQYSF